MWFLLLLALITVVTSYSEPNVGLSVHERQQLARKFSNDLIQERVGGCYFPGISKVSGIVEPNIPATELSALQDLYDATDGPHWHWKERKESRPWVFHANANPCRDKWTGIRCANDSSDPQVLHVVKLDLSIHRLNGTLPESIGLLSDLNLLTMFQNKLHGTIPDSVGNLKSLNYFDLSNNFLHGKIPPTFYNLTQLREIFIGANSISGSISYALRSFTNLTRLGLSENKITGSIPPFLTQLTQLIFIDVSNNPMHGSIPENIGALSELKLLWISNSSITGTIPKSFCNLTKLLYFYMNKNYIHGSLPDDLGNISKLLFFDTDSNSITGSLPSSMASLTDLIFFGGNHNYYTGTLPDFLWTFTKLFNLYLNGNQFSGTISERIADLQHLSFLYLNSNRLQGSIPTSICSVRKLTYLLLYDNQFTGTIPTCIGEMTELKFLYLQGNKLTGTLPLGISRLGNLSTLLVQDNLLTGTLDGVFDPISQQKLITIQVSGNQFTGTLPEQIFQLPGLSVFSAVSNCFHGNLQDFMCNATGLNTLALDGLHSAQDCRKNILPTVISKSYTSDQTLNGHIPVCLFALPSLGTLHLSGNSFTGSLRDDLVISSSLLDLSLSHNDLTGSIPSVIQHRVWYNLDLSYNKFVGSLSTISPELTRNFTFRLTTNRTGSPYTITKNVTTAVLTLENNRLSGHIPPYVKAMSNLSVLAGNLFSCDFDKQDLPPHDSARTSYSCGSNSFLFPFYFWVGFILVAMGIALELSYLGKVCFAEAKNVLSTLQSWYVVTLKNNATNRACNIYYALTRASLICTGYILLVLLPAYCTLSAYYGTHLHQYAWAASAAFLSGTTPAAVMLVLLLIFLCITVHFYGVCVNYALAFFTGYSGSLSTDSLQSSPHTPPSESTTEQSRSDSNSPSTPTNSSNAGPSLLEVLTVYAVFIVANSIVVVGVNVAFVWIVLYQSTALTFLAQILLSFFKVLWNTVCSRHIIRIIVYHCAPSSRHTRFATVYFFPVLLFVGLFNNIAIPCLVVAVISPNCFYSLFHAAEAVHSQYVYLVCGFQTPSKCYVYEPRLSVTSYSPPFTYSYQCSSSFITYYAPAFLFQCITISVINPMTMVIFHYLYKDSTPGFFVHEILNNFMPQLWKGLPSEETTARWRLKSTSGGVAGLDKLSNNESPPKSPGNDTLGGGELSVSALHRTLMVDPQEEVSTHSPHRRPLSLRSLIPNAWREKRYYFDANLTLISFLTLMGILMTFGVVFPPLAAVLAVTLVVEAVLTRLKVGRILKLAEIDNRPDCVAVIESDCRHIGSTTMTRYSVWMLVVFSSWFYSLFLFDTSGDAVGVMKSFWVLVVMTVSPILIFAVYRMYQKCGGGLNPSFTVTGVMMGLVKSNTSDTGQPAVGLSADDVVFNDMIAPL